MRFPAMILAAGRGERMRPLSDACPKPLLPVAGEPLIARQIRTLARGGFTDIVINAAHLAGMLVEAIGDGARYGARVRWSIEREALETAGGIATARPLLGDGPALIVSGDLWTSFDYASLQPAMRAMAGREGGARVHLVMVPNPAYHPRGDFVLVPQESGPARIAAEGGPRLTYGNIGVFDLALFAELSPGTKSKLSPHLNAWIAGGRVTGERFDGPWENVGTPADLARLDAQVRADVKENLHR